MTDIKDEKFQIEFNLCDCFPKTLCFCFPKNEEDREITEKGLSRLKIQFPFPSLEMFLRCFVFIAIFSLPASTYFLTKYFGKEGGTQDPFPCSPGNKTSLWQVNTDPPSYIFGRLGAQPGLVWGAVSNQVSPDLKSQEDEFRKSDVPSAYICAQDPGIQSDQIEMVKYMYSQDIIFQDDNNCLAEKLPNLENEYYSINPKIENLARKIGHILQKKDDGKSKFFSVGQDTLLGYNSILHILRRHGFKIKTLCR